MFVLVDCNNFYVSCEKVCAPWLEGKPVIVGGEIGGCVVARSQEAKCLGIRVGEPIFKIKNFCSRNGVVIKSPNFSLYQDFSHKIMNLLSQEACDMEVYSVDEAFLRCSSLDLYKKCVDIRQTIGKYTGIPVSLGIGETKTIAKMANSCAKGREDGICDLSSKERLRDVLRDFPIGDVWGIGEKGEKKMLQKGVRTALDFCSMNPSAVRYLLGVHGERMYWELRGRRCFSLEKNRARRSIQYSRLFPREVTALFQLKYILTGYVEKACQSLKRSCVRSMYVFLETSFDQEIGRRPHVGKLFHFPFPTDDRALIRSYAHMLLQELFREGSKYKKCGIVLMDLLMQDHVAPDFFVKKVWNI